MWRGGATGRALDLRSTGRGFKILLGTKAEFYGDSVGFYVKYFM